MRKFSSILLCLACASLALLASACAGPPPGPRIVLHPVRATPSRPRLRQPDPCKTPVGAKLTDTQKASLFQEFDAWQQDRRPAGVPAETALPPPGPIPKSKASTSPACRIASP